MAAEGVCQMSILLHKAILLALSTFQILRGRTTEGDIIKCIPNRLCHTRPTSYTPVVGLLFFGSIFSLGLKNSGKNGGKEDSDDFSYFKTSFSNCGMFLTLLVLGEKISFLDFWVFKFVAVVSSVKY